MVNQPIVWIMVLFPRPNKGLGGGGVWGMWPGREWLQAPGNTDT